MVSLSFGLHRKAASIIAHQCAPPIILISRLTSFVAVFKEDSNGSTATAMHLESWVIPLEKVDGISLIFELGKCIETEASYRNLAVSQL
jgi:hypothetical protein